MFAIKYNRTWSCVKKNCCVTLRTEAESMPKNLYKTGKSGGFSMQWCPAGRGLKPTLPAAKIHVPANPQPGGQGFTLTGA